MCSGAAAGFTEACLLWHTPKMSMYWLHLWAVKLCALLLCVQLNSVLFFFPIQWSVLFISSFNIHEPFFLHHSGTSMNGLDEAWRCVYLVRHTQMDKRWRDCWFLKDWLFWINKHVITRVITRPRGLTTSVVAFCCCGEGERRGG